MQNMFETYKFQHYFYLEGGDDCQWNIYHVNNMKIEMH